MVTGFRIQFGCLLSGAFVRSTGAIDRSTGTTYLTGDAVCSRVQTPVDRRTVHFIVARTRRAGARTCQGLSEVP